MRSQRVRRPDKHGESDIEDARVLRHHAERVHLLPAQHSVFSQAMVIEALKILGDSSAARTNASHGAWRTYQTLHTGVLSTTAHGTPVAPRLAVRCLKRPWRSIGRNGF